MLSIFDDVKPIFNIGKLYFVYDGLFYFAKGQYGFYKWLHLGWLEFRMLL